MIKGKQSIAFEVSPYLEESASVVGKKEGEELMAFYNLGFPPAGA